MTVEVVSRELEYYTLEVKTRTDDKEKEYLTWDYGSATYFVILKLSVSFELSDINTPAFFELLREGVQRCFNPSGQPIDGDVEFDDDKKLSIISLNQFIRTGRFYYDPNPMKVVVLCAERRNDMIRVHVPDDPEMSATFIPAKVNIAVTKVDHEVKKAGFFSNFKKAPQVIQRQIYQVKVTNLSQLYREGLYYCVSGEKTRYPITQEMAGKQFSISLLPGKTPEFHVDKNHLQDFVLNIKKNY